MSSSAEPNPVKALVLAGGKGTRLRPLTYAMAKQLVPVANKPILHYALNSLYLAGIRDMGIVISPETGESIRQSVQQWCMTYPETAITYILQQEPAGLAHAVKISRAYLGDSDFLMYLGDNLINANLKTHLAAFQSSGVTASILLKPVDNPSAFGVADCDQNGTVIRLVEKPEHPNSNLALIGVYLFKSQVFEAINQIVPSHRGELEITDAIQYLIDQHYQVSSRIHEGWWLDTGKKDDLLAANKVVLGEKIQPEITGQISEDCILTGAVIVEEGAVVTHSTLHGPCVIGAGSSITNSTIEPFTSVGSQCQLSGVTVGNSVILDHCTLQEIAQPIQNSITGQHCHITGATLPTPSGVVTGHQFVLADRSEIRLL